MNEYELIQAISGADEQGYGKCTISIQPQRCDIEGNTLNTDDEYITEKPVVQLCKQPGGFVLLDLIFESTDDVDLHRIYGYLQEFFSAENSVDDSVDDFPLFLLTIVPEALNGEYFALGINPVFYALTPDDVKGEPKIIRMLFIAQEKMDDIPNFLFLKSDEEELENILFGDEEE